MSGSQAVLFTKGTASVKLTTYSHLEPT